MSGEEKYMKISEAFDLYKNNYMLYKSNSKRILENHEYVKDRIIKSLGDIEVEDLTLEDVQKWFSEILVGRAWNTVRNDVVRLRVVLKYLDLNGVKCLRAELIPVPKREEVTRDFLTPEEVEAMIDSACNIRSKFVVSLLYSSGIRLSEFLSLDRSSIQDRKFQVVGKGSKLRLCFTDDRTISLMGEYLSTRDDDCEALVVSRIRKERMTATNVQMLIKNAAKAAGINKHVTPHVLRHSFATNFVHNNGNIRYLSTMLGHKSVATTMIYTHVVDNDLEKQYREYHTV
jgi:site-specific recombinase XerD